MTQRYQLAQVNIGRARAAMEDPVTADFAARLKVRNVSLSLTHTAEYGMAHVILED